MAYTGYKITQYIDGNPDSETYGEVWEERVLDEENCGSSSGTPVLISTGCELVTSGYTGYRIYTYYNSVTNEYTTERSLDSSCSESSNEEMWIATGEEYCELDSKGLFTGYMIQIQKQSNHNLANYGETREFKYASSVCGLGSDRCAVYKDVSETCHIASDGCSLTFDGTADVVKLDINPSSPTYNQLISVNVESESCDNCTDTTFSWEEIGDLCGSELCSSGVSAEFYSLYTVSQKYKTISGNTYPMGEYMTILKEQDSPDCGYVGPRYRWVSTDETVCYGYDKYVIEKEQISYDSGATWGDYFESGSPVTRVSTNPIQVNSYDCGYPMYRWVDTDEVVCVECDNPQFSWRVYPSSQRYICIDGDKWSVQYYAASCDGGTTWQSVKPEITKPYNLIESGSTDCNIENTE